MVHLHARSWFSFLAGGSAPEALVREAARHGQPALALADRYGVYGLVRFAAACRREGVQPVFGATLDVEGFPLVLLVTSREGYRQLCQLCSLAHGFSAASLMAPGERLAEAPEVVPPGKQEPRSLALGELDGRTAAMLALTGGPEGKLDRLVRRRRLGEAERWLGQLAELFPERLYVELAHRLQPGDSEALRQLARLGERSGVPTVASNAVRYARPEDYAVYDALTCVRLGRSVGDPHPERPVNDAAYLCDEAELLRRVPYPEAIARTREVAERCAMELLAEEITPPTAQLPTGQSAAGYLRELCLEGWDRRYPAGIPLRATPGPTPPPALEDPLGCAETALPYGAPGAVWEAPPPTSALRQLGRKRVAAAPPEAAGRAGARGLSAAVESGPRAAPASSWPPPDLLEREGPISRPRQGRELPHRLQAKPLGIPEPAPQNLPPPRDTREKALRQLEHELRVVTDLQLEEFFLVVREVVDFARSQGIRCAGRGSAANSIIAYVLGITAVDPQAHNLLFERFLHRGRKGMPDIDVDFDSERREEVIAWMERRFGVEHSAMTANVITYRLKLALRDMLKVLGFTPEQVDRTGPLIGPWDGLNELRERRGELTDLLGNRQAVDTALRLVERIYGCPRHLGLHSGGVVLAREPLSRFSPVQTSAGGVRQLQFDKDDIEALGLIKFDVLGLRMLAVLSEALELQRAYDGEEIPLDDLTLDDEPSFELIRSGKTLSLFQIESPGQINLLSRTQPRVFRDLVAQVALFRPGPLQGRMVNPYVERITGNQPISYPHPSLEPILKDTYGVILFQEQVLEISHQFAGMSLDEADDFRRLMSKFRDPGGMSAMKTRFVAGAQRTQGVSLELAEEVFRQVSSFVGYGFCRSHAAAFARTVFHSAYLKCHHPAAYMAAFLQHLPGFFPRSTVLEEVRHMGVPILPVCAWRSDVRYRLEPYREKPAIRLPLTAVAGLSPEQATRFVRRRAGSLDELLARVDLPVDVWESLARAGAFDARLERREALWRVGLFRARQSGGTVQAPHLKPGGPAGGPRAPRSRRLRSRPDQPEQRPLLVEPADAHLLPALEPLAAELALTWDYSTQGFSPREHPLARHRGELEAREVRPIAALHASEDKQRLTVAGLVVLRQRPPTARGVMFLLLEDETERVQCVLPPPVYERLKKVVGREGAVIVTGLVERAGRYHRCLLVQDARPLGLKVFADG